MIIIKDDTLKHVDSSLDILEHYGVKGMKSFRGITQFLFFSRDKHSSL